MPYKFAGNANEIDEELKNDIQSLNRVPTQQYTIIIEKVMTSYENLYKLSMDETLDNITNELTEKLELKSKSLRKVIKSLFILITGAIKYNLTQNSLNDDLNEIGLNKDLISIFCDIWTKYYVALNRNVIETSLKFNEIVDMQWKFGVIAASDSLKQIGSTFLQIKFVLNKGNNNFEHVSMELSLPQFYQFLKEMEKAQATMGALE